MTAWHQAAQKAVEALPRYRWDQDMDVLAGHYPDGEWVRRADVIAALQQQPEPVAKPSRMGEDGWRKLAESQAALLALQEVPREPVADKRRVAMETVYFRRSPNEPWDSLTVLAGTATQHVREELIESIVSAADGIAASPSTTQQQEAGSGWRTIDSAPKDGTEILVWRDDAGAFMAMWTCVNDLRTTSDKDRDDLDEDTLFSYDWFGGDAEGNFRCDGSEVPTHWQPMPAAPSTPSREEAGLPAVDSQTNPDGADHA